MNVYGIAAVLGDTVGFILARRYGKTVLSAIGLRRLIEAPSFAKIEHRIERAPNITVIFSRIVTTIAPVVNIVAGLSRMSLRTFLVAGVIGQLLNTLLNALYGYAIGGSWTAILGVTGNVGILIRLLILLLIVRGRRLYSRVTRHFAKNEHGRH